MEGGEAKLDVYNSQYEDSEPVLQGSISVPGTSGQDDGAGGLEFNTLDEPIKETIRRDLVAVGSKFYHVLVPKDSKSLLKDWDLWGPLILCTFMATVLQGHDTDSDSKDGDGGPQFAEVFVIVWVGAMIVTLNTKLLGGHISFFPERVCSWLLPASIGSFPPGVPHHPVRRAHNTIPSHPCHCRSNRFWLGHFCFDAVSGRLSAP